MGITSGDYARLLLWGNLHPSFYFVWHLHDFIYCLSIMYSLHMDIQYKLISYYQHISRLFLKRHTLQKEIHIFHETFLPSTIGPRLAQGKATIWASDDAPAAEVLQKIAERLGLRCDGCLFMRFQDIKSVIIMCQCIIIRSNELKLLSEAILTRPCDGTTDDHHHEHHE